jgi:uncharacterized protein (DUF697 family)
MVRLLPWRAESKLPQPRIPATPDEIEAIRVRCRKMVTKRALASAGVALVPVPGADIVADVTLLVQLIERVNQEFGLTPAQIERLNPQRRFAVYRAVVGFGGAMVGRVITRDLVISALRVVGVRLTAKQATTACTSSMRCSGRRKATARRGPEPAYFGAASDGGRRSAAATDRCHSSFPSES